jgi:hypothetical protein
LGDRRPAMSAPLILISSSEIKEGKLTEYEAFEKEIFEVIEANEPRLLGLATYVSEDGMHATTVQIHPDAESLMFHLQIVREKIEIAFEHLELKSVTICGELNDQALEMARQISGSGVAVDVNPKILGGFTRVGV